MLACDAPTGAEPYDVGVRERWRQPQPGVAVAQPAVLGSTVFFATGDGDLVARDAARGIGGWSTRLDVVPIDGANLLVGPGVVAAATQRQTVAVDAATGQVRWRFAAPRDDGIGAAGLPGYMTRAHLDGDSTTVYVPAWGASVSAVDWRTSAARWTWQPGRTSTDTAAADRFRSGAAGVRVGDETVYASAWHFTVANGVTAEAWLVALDRRTGVERWRATFPNPRGGTVLGPPALTADAVLLRLNDGRVVAVDRGDGRLRWSWRAAAPVLTPISQVVAAGDAVFVDGGDSRIYALDAATGRERWRAPFATQTSAALTVSARRVYAPVFGLLHVFDRATGRRLAEARDPNRDDPLFASPVTEWQGAAYVVTNDAAWSFVAP